MTCTMKKRFLAFLIILLSINAIAQNVAQTFDIYPDGYWLRATVTDNEKHLLEISKMDTYYEQQIDIVLQSSYNLWDSNSEQEVSYTLVGIADSAFVNYRGIRSITIPKTVQYIGKYAFENNEIKSVEFAEGLQKIDAFAFMGAGLEYVTLPSTLKEIGLGAFSCCESLSQVTNNTTLDLSKNNIFAGCFAYNDSYEAHTYTVTARSNESALWYAIGEDNLNDVVVLKVKGTINSWDLMVLNNKLPNLRYIDLSEVSIVACDYEFHEGVGTRDNELPDYAFEDHIAYEILAPTNITYMGEAAFRNTKNLRHFTIPSRVKEIKYQTFCNSGIETIVIPNGVEHIYNESFGYCRRLKSVTFPESLTHIDTYVFYSCDQLKDVIWNATMCDNETWDSPFWYSNIERISFGKNVTKIPDNLLKATDIYMRTSVQKISIPSSVKYIGQNAFSSCPVTDVYAYTIEPTEINDYTFLTYKSATLHIPKQAYYNYYWADVWCKFQNIVKEEGVEYEDFYLNNDYETNENTGTIEGEPNVDMGNESGWIVGTDDQQRVDTVFIDVDGDKSGSIIAGEGNLHANNINIAIQLTLGEWQFCCFPYDIDIETQIEYDGALAIYEYDGLIRSQQGNGGWKRVTNGKIHKFKGYIIQGSKTADMHVKFDDVTFAEGNENIALEFYGGNTPVDDGWNLIGNPYLSYYSIKDLNFDCPVMVWDKENKTYRALRGQDDDYRLAPFEGFFVQAPRSDINVGFMTAFRQTYQNTNNVASADNKSASINNNRKLINLTFTDGTLTDRTRVVFNESASSGYELGTDMAKTMSRDASAPQVYTVNDGIMYSINERPLGDSRVDLGVKVAKQGTYTFSAERADGPAILTDNATGVTVDLSERSYEVRLESGTYNDRFTLNKSDIATGIENISLTDIDQNEEVDVYDIAGRLLKRNVTVGEVKKADKGVYILKGATSTYKVAVK